MSQSKNNYLMPQDNANSLFKLELTILALLDTVNNSKLQSSKDTNISALFNEIKSAIEFIHQNFYFINLQDVPIYLLDKADFFLEECNQQLISVDSNLSHRRLINAKNNVNQALFLTSTFLFKFSKTEKDYLKLVDELTSNSKSTIDSLLFEVKNTSDIFHKEANKLKSFLEDFKNYEEEIKNFHSYLFVGSDDNKSVQSNIKDLLLKLSANKDAISEFHHNLFVSSNSISNDISVFSSEIKEIHNTFKPLNSRFVEQTNAIDNYHKYIFGDDTTDGNPEQIGLRNQIETRLRLLKDFEDEHRKRHEALSEKINSLLPGATSAGLATAYNKLKNSFDERINNYTKAFYGSLILLFISAILMVVDISFSQGLGLKIIKADDWSDMLRMLLARAPIFIPVVWFAVFSATRRSQYERLQQEYAHKEALASSYEGYKKQLQDLKIDSDDLQKELIAKSIDAISYNASKSLDGKHLEKPPVLNLLEKLSLEEVKKILELIKDTAKK